MSDFNLNQYAECLRKKRIPQDFLKQTPTEIVQPEITIRKPEQHEFFRIHPDDEYCYQSSFLDFGRNGGLYFIEQELWHELEDDLEEKVLLLAISKRGNVPFLWPIKTGQNSWNSSAFSVALEARDYWVKRQSNPDQGVYQAVRALGNLPDPTWPSESMDELVKTAFGSRYIDDSSHHVLRELRGEL